MFSKIKTNQNIYPWLRDRITPIYSTFFLLIFRIFPIKNKKVFIVSYFGKGYGDNGKYIADALLSKCNNIKIYWGCKKDFKSSIPNTINYVKYFSPKYFYHLATAKIWINNSRFTLGTKKRKKQFYIQTWHGGTAFKKVEKDVESQLPKSYIEGAKHDAKMTDLMTSDSKWLSNLYRNSFWYKKGEILEIGLPRNDILIQKEKHQAILEKVKKYYHIKKSEKIFLYAPTFRKDEKLHYYNLNFSAIKETLEIKTGEKWKLLIRLHPNISRQSEKLGFYNSEILNATSSPDMQELIIASGMMMTDYSSCLFDFALLNKPGLLYAPDYENYTKDRGFYFNYFKLPFPIAETEGELIRNIEKFDLKKYRKNLLAFLRRIEINETGKSSEAVAKIIMEKTK